jgi:ribosomal protein S18 acetylase RimI-like enzyme
MPEFKVLIDTNVFIGLEDAGQIQPKFADLVRKCGEHGVKLFVHEDAKRDIERDRDLVRRKASLSRVRKFNLLSGIPKPNQYALQKQYGRIARSNDEVDVALLHAVNIGAIDFLVTQDQGIQARVKDSALSKQVLSVDDALVWLRQTFEPTQVRLPLVEECKAHEIDPSDEIFSSLRDGYPDFDRWWREKCVRQHRSCWIASIDGEVAGLVVRKDENQQQATVKTEGEKILKVCTFKVKPKFRGEKLGELLLKQALWFGQKNVYDLTYLTTFPDQEVLIRVLEYFGFQHTLTLPNGEFVYEKPLSRERLTVSHAADLFTACRVNYPRFVARPPANVFCVPIQNEYHQKLFPELAIPSPLPLFADEPAFILPTQGSRIPGNTIRKVYLCRAQTKSIKPGDCLLFYRSKSEGFMSSQAITSVAVAEGVTETTDHDELVRLTAKRSVFSEDELRAMTQDDPRPIKVIDFLLAGHIHPPIAIADLLQLGVLRAGPQSITRVPTDRFALLRDRIKLGFEL